MDEYVIVKTLHIIAIISWMAGLLYLPRLYVYHASAKVGSELDTTLQIMERKLLRFIMNPAMIASFILGLYLIHILGGFKAIGAWSHLKLTLVLIMAGCHGMMSKFRK
ncbi:MAG: CopD family protein, partial [Pseudomonadota bacterium]